MFKSIIEFIKRQIFEGRVMHNKIVSLCVTFYLVLFFMKITTGLFGLENIYSKILYYFSLSPNYKHLLIKPWSIFSYILINTNLWHLFWSMLALSYFSNLLTYLTDYRRVLKVYLVGVIGGAAFVILFHEFIPKFSWNENSVMGIDSLCYALITACSIIAPNYLIGFLFIREVKLKYVLFVTLIGSLYLLDSGSYNGVVQVGGAIAAYIYISIIYRSKKSFKKFKRLFSKKNNF